MPGAVSNSVVIRRPADVVGLMRKETATVTLRQYQRRLAQETLSFVCNNRKRTVQHQSSHFVPVGRSTYAGNRSRSSLATCLWGLEWLRL